MDLVIENDRTDETGDSVDRPVPQGEDIAPQVANVNSHPIDIVAGPMPEGENRDPTSESETNNSGASRSRSNDDTAEDGAGSEQTSSSSSATFSSFLSSEDELDLRPPPSAGLRPPRQPEQQMPQGYRNDQNNFNDPAAEEARAAAEMTPPPHPLVSDLLAQLEEDPALNFHHFQGTPAEVSQPINQQDIDDDDPTTIQLISRLRIGEPVEVINIQEPPLVVTETFEEQVITPATADDILLAAQRQRDMDENVERRATPNALDRNLEEHPMVNDDDPADAAPSSGDDTTGEEETENDEPTLQPDEQQVEPTPEPVEQAVPTPEPVEQTIEPTPEPVEPPVVPTREPAEQPQMDSSSGPVPSSAEPASESNEPALPAVVPEPFSEHVLGPEPAVVPSRPQVAPEYRPPIRLPSPESDEWDHLVEPTSEPIPTPTVDLPMEPLLPVHESEPARETNHHDEDHDDDQEPVPMIVDFLSQPVPDPHNEFSFLSCHDVGSWFNDLGPEFLGLISPECMILCEPSFYDQLNLGQLDSIGPEILLADQAAMLSPEIFAEMTVERAKKFGKRADEFSPCAGMTAAQLDALPSKEVFRAFGDEAMARIQPAQLHSSSARVISWLPREYFSRRLTSGLPKIDELLSKATSDQLKAIPEAYEYESDSPFYKLKINIGEMNKKQQEHLLGCMSQQAIELVDKETLESIEDFSLIRESVRSSISRESFASIPPSAVSDKEIIRLASSNTKICSELTPDHFKSDQIEINGLCASQLPQSTWDHVVSHAESLPADFLSHENGQHFTSTGISLDGLRIAHWKKLGQFTVNGAEHPCASISMSQVDSADNFWCGMTLGCLVSLSFVEEIEETHLKLIKKKVLHSLPESTAARLPEKLRKRFTGTQVEADSLSSAVLSEISEAEMKNVTADDFGRLPLSTMVSLDRRSAKKMSKNRDLLAKVTPDAVSALSPEFLAALSPVQLSELPAEACAGFSSEHLSNIPLASLPAEGFAYISPALMSEFSAEQLQAIPAAAWSSSLTREHVQALPPSALSGFKLFGELGSEMDPLSEHHPCLGMTPEHIKALTPSAKADFLKQCRPVFASQELQRSSSCPASL